ncbi:MAG: hypothetical protein H0T20_06800 [Actinobacteria bacterium]|nr:hypothetical protein [Actinomycetota bacterium]
MARTFVAVGTTVLLATCGGGGTGEMRLTLTDTGCTYEGDETPAAGMFTIEVENQSSKEGAFALGRVSPGATIDDLEAYADEERGRIRQRAEILGAPAFYSQVVRVGAPPGKSSALPADVNAGTYALTCFNDPPLTALYVAGQLEVGE